MAETNNVFPIPSYDQFEDIKKILTIIASNLGGMKLKNIADIQSFVRMGFHTSSFDIAGQIEVDKNTSLTVAHGHRALSETDNTPSGITAVSVTDVPTVLNHFGSIHGVYALIYDGSVWKDEQNNTIVLSEIGLQTQGTAIVNDAIIVNINSRHLYFDIVDFDKHTPQDTRFTHTLDLCLHDIFQYGIQFDAPELLYWAETEMPAGTYYVKLTKAAYGGGATYDGVYKFTTTQTIPAGGGFRHSNIGWWQQTYTHAQVIGKYIYTYGVQPKRSVIESAISFVEVTDSTEIANATIFATFSATTGVAGVDYTHCNSTERNVGGSNRWKTSSIRQWLNSEAPAVASSDTTTVSNWWTPQTVFDMPPSNARMPGFLYGVEKAFLDMVKPVAIECGITPFDRTSTSGTKEVTYDRVYLLSRTEVFGSNEIVAENSQLEYFKGMTNADRKKYEGTTARHWWLRSASGWSSTSVLIGLQGGSLNSGDALNGCGVVPACSIS